MFRNKRLNKGKNIQVASAFPPHPNRIRRRLKWSDDTTITTLSSWRFGLSQFWNQKPGYLDQYFLMYKVCRIMAVHLKVTVQSQTTNTPAEVVTCVLPLSDYSKTLAQVKQLPRAKMAYLSGSGGIDKVSLAHSARLGAATLGGISLGRDYQQSASEAGSTLALLPDTPVLALYVGGASTEPTLRVFISVDYDIEFFQAEFPGSVTLSQNGSLPVDKTGLTHFERGLNNITQPPQHSWEEEEEQDDDWSHQSGAHKQPDFDHKSDPRLHGLSLPKQLKGPPSKQLKASKMTT